MELMMIAAFCCYLLILFIIAYAAVISGNNQEQATAQDVQGSSDFMLGGRSLTYWVTALSAHAADMSDWLFMGLPGAIYLQGSVKLWVPVSLVLGMFCCWHFVAEKLRRATQALGAVTLAGYFQKRYADTSGIISLATTFVVLLFFTAYLAVGIKGLSLICKPVFGISYHTGALIAVFAILCYTLVGGYLAVAWTDAFQAIFLLCSLIITAAVAWYQSDGIPSYYAAAMARQVPLSFLPYPGYQGIIALILDPLGWGLGYFGMPHILSKFMGMRDPAQMYKAKYLGISWQIVALSAAVAVAVIAYGFFPQGLANPEMLFVEMVLTLFSPFFAGLIICAILAATFSTMDSMLLVLAGLVTDDLYGQYVKHAASEKNKLFVYRATILFFACIAFVIAYDEHGSSIFSLVEYAWSGLGASFSPLVLVSLYASWPTRTGAAAGIITGGAVAALTKAFVPTFYGYTLTPVIPGFFAHLLVLYLVSLVTKQERLYHRS